MQLRVEQANWSDVFGDVVRIPSAYRKHPNGETIENGTVVRIEHNGKRIVALARGVSPNDESATIYMDEFLRRKLKVNLGDQVESTGIRAATFYEQLLWYRNASNPAIRIPAWVALISLGLGVLSVVLGTAGIVIAICAG